VPLCAVLLFTGRFISPGLGSRQAEIDHRLAGIHPADLRVSPYISNQYDFVNASRHCSALLDQESIISQVVLMGGDDHQAPSVIHIVTQMFLLCSYQNFFVLASYSDLSD
jgi:hypothetical protein